MQLKNDERSSLKSKSCPVCNLIFHFSSSNCEFHLIFYWTPVTRFSPVGDCPNAKLAQHWSCCDCNEAEIATSITCFPSLIVAAAAVAAAAAFDLIIIYAHIQWTRQTHGPRLNYNLCACGGWRVQRNYLVRILPECARSCWPAMGLVGSGAGHKNCSLWRIPWPKKKKQREEQQRAQLVWQRFQVRVRVLVDLFDMARTNS